MSDNNEIKVPTILGARPRELVPALREWKRRNPYTDWTVLVKRGLKRELLAAGLDGKRFSELLAIDPLPVPEAPAEPAKEGEVAA